VLVVADVPAARETGPAAAHESFRSVLEKERGVDFRHPKRQGPYCMRVGGMCWGIASLG
jgi:hypothetical protein